MIEGVSPTKSKLLETKRSLKLAREGYTLLNKKRNVLIREIMQLIDDAQEIQKSVEKIFSEAYDNLQKADISVGIEYVQEIGLATEEVEDIDIRLRSIMGVEVPNVSKIDDKIEPSYGFMRTNATLDKANKAFKRVLALISRLTEIETTVYRLATEIKKTQRRVNALENVLIPRYENIVKFIEDTLEETERENFFRMKKIKNKEQF
ncbi:MAG: V-type ATP synthase subunit D [Kosmotoga sp.]|nr:MAG: V-type ATP synthase subunit D [Kosmotoga sp.]